MRGRKIAIGLLVASALVWGAPTTLYSFAYWDQSTQGNPSIFLFVLGPGAYGLGLVLSVLLPALLMRRRRIDGAIATSAASLLIGVPLAAWAILMLGST